MCRSVVRVAHFGVLIVDLAPPNWGLPPDLHKACATRRSGSLVMEVVFFSILTRPMMRCRLSFFAIFLWEWPPAQGAGVGDAVSVMPQMPKP